MSDVVTLDKFNELLDIVVKQIQIDETFQPETILALSTGGFPVGAALAKRLGIKSRNVIGMPVYKDDDGDYHLDNHLVKLDDCAQRRILVVDEASKWGLLTKKAVDAVVEHGGVAKSCVLIAWQDGIQPDYVAETCAAEPPDFYWEFKTTLQ